MWEMCERLTRSICGNIFGKIIILIGRKLFPNFKIFTSIRDKIISQESLMTSKFTFIFWKYLPFFVYYNTSDSNILFWPLLLLWQRTILRVKSTAAPLHAKTFHTELNRNSRVVSETYAKGAAVYFIFTSLALCHVS